MTTDARALRSDAARNRVKLLEAAAEVFGERGLGAPLDEIARRASVSIGTLYNHFATKDDLFDAILPQQVAALDEVAAGAASARDPWTGFVQYVQGIFELQAANRGLNDALSQRYPNATALDAACREGFTRAEEVIDRARRSGQLRQDFEMQDFALLIWTISRIIDTTAAVSPDAWRRWMGFHLDGLRADAARPIATPAMSAEAVASAFRGPSTHK